CVCVCVRVYSLCSLMCLSAFGNRSEGSLTVCSKCFSKYAFFTLSLCVCVFCVVSCVYLPLATDRRSLSLLVQSAALKMFFLLFVCVCAPRPSLSNVIRQKCKAL